MRGGLYARLVLEILSGDVGMAKLYERLNSLLQEAEQWQVRQWPDVLYWVQQAERRQNILLTAGFGATRSP